jgi:signal recognition particle GTPase
MHTMTRLSNICAVLALVCSVGTSFLTKAPWTTTPARIETTTELSMVFDFFKQRSEEGLEELSKLANAASKGQLGLGLTEVAAYTKVTNDAFAVGLAKSRNRFLGNLEAVMSGSEDALEDLQDVLLQADLGMATAEDICQEVQSLREDSTKFLSRDDLMSVMRGKLIETLEIENAAIRFASPEEKLPTVLFIMGANGMGKYV